MDVVNALQADQRDRAGRHRAHRRPRIQRPAQFQPGDWSSSSTRCRSACATASPVLLGDVAKSATASPTQTNIVRINGQRATYLTILKNADASTLAVVDAVRDAAAGDPGRRAERARAEARFRPVGVRARRGRERDRARRSSRRSWSR